MSDRSSSISEITALVSATTLIVSILHEWAYFHVLDFHFLGFLSLSDFFRIAVGWLPVVLVGWLILGMNELLTQGIEKGMTEEEIVVTSGWPKFYRWFRNFAGLSIPALIFGVGLTDLLFMPSPDYFFAGITVMIGWGVVSNRILGIQRMQDRYSALSRAIIVLVPILAAMVLGFGAGRAQSALKVDHGAYNLSLGDQRMNGVQVLRSFELGVVIRDPAKPTINFFPWDAVEALEKVSTPITDAKSIMCDLFELGCLPNSEVSERKRN